MSEVKLVVQDMDRFFADTRKAARRIDAGDMQARPALLAFESMESLLKVLTPNRWALLRRLRSTGPSSVRALARSLGRDYRGVHADAAALLAVGLVEKQADGRIFVPWSRIIAEMSMNERGRLQLRLQQTVEGLSVAAVSYYVVGLIGDIAHGTRLFGQRLESETVTAVSVPFVVMAVWLLVRRIRRRHSDEVPSPTVAGR